MGYFYMRFRKVVTSILKMGAVEVTEISTDGTMAGNSDAALPTEKAVKTYVDTVAVGGAVLDYISIVADATEDNIATFDDSGEVKDSGHALSEYMAVTGAATGDITYYDGADWQVLTAGSSGDVLTVDGDGLPSWVSPG